MDAHFHIVTRAYELTYRRGVLDDSFRSSFARTVIYRYCRYHITQVKHLIRFIAQLLRSSTDESDPDTAQRARRMIHFIAMWHDVDPPMVPVLLSELKRVVRVRRLLSMVESRIGDPELAHAFASNLLNGDTPSYLAFSDEMGERGRSRYRTSNVKQYGETAEDVGNKQGVSQGLEVHKRGLST
ncbi:hypothetical protein BV25DRAFT_1918186 [Artomyces pyxidatus]|uniref:Uncharacterized protein n=1 Tax=Artomyces pyxidatus TaxID=48021 RepID=A0ACB8SUD9_9AGAM|nr:hypothetical protein BV25DRAFT_1918186 [Artomyces pyxidatus]